MKHKKQRMYIKSLGLADEEAMTIIMIKTEHLEMDATNPGYFSPCRILQASKTHMS